MVIKVSLLDEWISSFANATRVVIIEIGEMVSGVILVLNGEKFRSIVAMTPFRCVNLNIYSLRFDHLSNPPASMATVSILR